PDHRRRREVHGRVGDGAPEPRLRLGHPDRAADHAAQPPAHRPEPRSERARGGRLGPASFPRTGVRELTAPAAWPPRGRAGTYGGASGGSTANSRGGASVASTAGADAREEGGRLWPPTL